MSVTVRGILRKAIRAVDNEIKDGTFTEGLPVLNRLKKEHVDILLDENEKAAMINMLKSLEKTIKKHLGIKEPEESKTTVQKISPLLSLPRL